MQQAKQRHAILAARLLASAVGNSKDGMVADPDLSFK